MKTENTYYHVPVWMSILVYSLIQAGLASKLKNSGKNDKGLYLFHASYGEEESRENLLIVWSATTSARLVCDHMKPLLPRDVRMLVSMAEEYARERNGREETKVYQGIIQLLIARTVELYSNEHPDETLIINGDFGLVGQLPPNGRLRINGEVERLEGSLGQILDVKSEKCPELTFPGWAWKIKGVWCFIKARPLSCKYPG